MDQTALNAHMNTLYLAAFGFNATAGTRFPWQGVTYWFDGINWKKK